jgi:hypothetical protein
LMDKTNANMLMAKQQMAKTKQKNNKMRNWKKINKELKVNGNEYIIAKKVWGVKLQWKVNIAMWKVENNRCGQHFKFRGGKKGVDVQ